MRIGLLTGGGDAPGLNGVLESACRILLRSGIDLVGIEDGFDGVLSRRTRAIDFNAIEGIHAEAGTILGTSNKTSLEGRQGEFIANYRALELDGMVVCGGDGTFAGLRPLANSISVVGVPKTIDNDLAGTDITFGFDTACTVVSEAVDALRVSARAHRRVIVLESMGRTAGWIALGGGLAGYADAILIPERPFSREKLLRFVQEKQSTGQRDMIIVMAEGAAAQGEHATVAFRVPGSPEPERLGGAAEELAHWIDAQTGWESRHVVLGHLQRARHPTVTDLFLTQAMGVEVARMVLEKAWGQAVVYRSGRVARAPIDDLMKPPRRVEPEHRWVQAALTLGIFI
jgi:6-phosphofructokinase 1